MHAVPCSLLHTTLKHQPGLVAVTDIVEGKSWTFGELVARAVRCRGSLAHLGMAPGDTVACDLHLGVDFAALLLACWDAGLQLRVEPPGVSGQLSRAVDEQVKLLVSNEPAMPTRRGVRHFSMAELGRCAVDRSFPNPIDSPDTATITAGPQGAGETMSSAALLQSAANFNAAHPTAVGETLLSTSSPLTLEDVCITTIIPLALGLHVMLAGKIADENPGLFNATAERATLCEFAAPMLLRLLEHNTVPHLPDHVRAVFCGSAGLSPADTARVEMALGRPLERGYGTRHTGFWAVASAGMQTRGTNYVAAIRELRSPLRLLGASAACTAGEILLRPAAGGAPAIHTGDVGWMTPAGTLEVAGKLSDVSVRCGQAILLAELDRLLSNNDSVRESRTFRERGMSPTEPVVCVCATDVSEATVRAWLLDQVGPEVAPNRILTVPPDACSALPCVDTLRSVASGRAGRAVVTALTARRFRRNPPYDEAGLVAATNAALLSGGKLEFLMFWGCGPRRHASAPDRAAIEALGAVLAAAEAAAPLQARAHIICTDIHATSNGHADSHFMNYFAEIRSLATELAVDFELESAVWRRGGLTRERILALEQEQGFERRWQNFPLQGRFVQQARRHSGLADKTAAARHYYATCLLERDVLKALFGRSVFLTYNGPDFNECFPDLPTLYVYPGPRGRNDKPWFIDVDERVAAE